MATYDNVNYMVAWDVVKHEGRRNTKAVEVGPWPDTTGWSNKYSATTGCCDHSFRELSDKKQAQLLVNQALSLVFDGVPSNEILEEFSKIRVWRHMRVEFPAGNYLAFLPDKGYKAWNPWTG